MRKKEKQLYPGVREAEQEKGKNLGTHELDPPRMIGGKPNYDAFPGWNAEKVLRFLNID